MFYKLNTVFLLKYDRIISVTEYVERSFFAMKFLKKHWFAILFDIAMALLFISIAGSTNSVATDLIIGFLSMLIIIGIQILYHKSKNFILSFFKPKKEKQMKLTDEMAEHYAQQGLTDDEITFFRKTMAETKKQILTLEDNINQTNSLKLVDHQTQVIIAAKGVFKELVEEPQKLHMMSEFLYTHLPNLVELTDKYNEVLDHAIKNEKTKATLDRSLEAIRNLSYIIVNDYNLITSDDLKSLDDGIDLAERQIKNLNKKENVH